MSVIQRLSTIDDRPRSIPPPQVPVSAGVVEDADLLPHDTTTTDRDQLFGRTDLEAFDNDRQAQHRCLERHDQIVHEHGIEPYPLFRLAVGVDSGISNKCIELRAAGWPTSRLWLGDRP